MSSKTHAACFLPLTRTLHINSPTVAYIHDSCFYPTTFKFIMLTHNLRSPPIRILHHACQHTSINSRFPPIPTHLHDAGAGQLYVETHFAFLQGRILAHHLQLRDSTMISYRWPASASNLFPITNSNILELFECMFELQRNLQLEQSWCGDR